MAYLNERLYQSVYSRWGDGSKVLLNAPTGMGKTTFILTDFLELCIEQQNKMLILCNRRLLREQYGYDLAERFFRYTNLSESVVVKTYQELAEEVRRSTNPKKIFDDFQVIICDEVHYFYYDSDFNGYGTFNLLQAIIYAGFFKTIVMITATMEETKPLLEKVFKQCAFQLKLDLDKSQRTIIEKYERALEIYDFQDEADYSKFKCYFVEDVESLAKRIVESDNKTIIFIDDKRKAENIKKLLVEKGKLPATEIFLLNAEKLDECSNNEVVRALALAHKVLPKVLITTSVLDNGVSIHDPEVGNIVLATESRISFVQMLGRLRQESIHGCNLFFYPRDVEYYAKRVEQYEEKIKKFNELEQMNLDENMFEFLTVGWNGNDEEACFIRKALLVTCEPFLYYEKDFDRIFLDHTYIRRTGPRLTLNKFAMEKTGDMLLAEKRFYKLALQGIEKVAEEQMSWLGKAKSELIVLTSTYIEEQKKRLREKLLSIKDVTLEEFGEIKVAISQEFRKDLFEDVVTKAGSFSTDKFETICDRFQTKLEVTKGDDKKNRYSVVEV